MNSSAAKMNSTKWCVSQKSTRANGEHASARIYLTQNVGLSLAVDLQRHIGPPNVDHSCAAHPVSYAHRFAVHNRRRADDSVNNTAQSEIRRRLFLRRQAGRRDVGAGRLGSNRRGWLGLWQGN